MEKLWSPKQMKDHIPIHLPELRLTSLNNVGDGYAVPDVSAGACIKNMTGSMFVCSAAVVMIQTRVPKRVRGKEYIKG
jgi:hypothetical protein